MLTIFIVSDATGETADRVVRSALTQFAGAAFRLARRSNVRTPEQVRAVVDEAARVQAIIVYTMVSQDLRRLMLEEARLQAVDLVDMLGPILDRLTSHFKLAPQQQPGLFGQLVDARAREIEAVDFVFRHDDGQNPDDLDRAEVVIVGISRTMKTPTSLYLAYRGWFVANVPLVPEVPPPERLASVPPHRVFCLIMSADRLQELRRSRAEQTNIPLAPYASVEQIHRELFFAEELARRHGWRKIDTTHKSVEEVGREISLLLGSEERAG